MLSRRIYYRFKPYLPWRLRMGMRRVVAGIQRRRYAQSWPINETAGRTPAGWPGWPGGKKFALVLTHDVEGVSGIAKCRQLMQLEQRLGFRSSFNFIPEGEYEVSPELRGELVQNGFETGVHDLRHDGKLYWRRAEFSENARSINTYLQDWNARGFRSGFMLHDRDCLNGLDIEYDASTFDTDPFEPQPEGVNTIFPYWVPRQKNGGGYVELPYTLPQDSTLFLVLQETSPEVWKKKLDWIVQRGGMALVNVHPDYLNFDDRNREISEYPAAFYEQLLEHLAKNYSGEYWHALPHQVARWYRENCVPAARQAAAEPSVNRLPTPVRLPEEKPLAGMSAAVVLYSYFATDPRPRREAEALARAGMEVDVLCLHRGGSAPWHEKTNGINVYHMPLRRRRASKLVYMLQYAWFLTCSFFFLSALGLKKRYQLVHVHNMPDFLVFSALLPRLRGAKVILDLHDPMPELFCSIYGLPEKHFIVGWLKKMERRSIGFADLVLTPNLAFKTLFTSRSCAPEKIEMVMNSPETTIFNPAKYPPAARPEKTFKLMYHGLLVERHGLDLAIRAVARLRERIPGIELHMYGEPTDYLKKIQELVRELALDGVVQAHGYKPLDGIARDISNIDLGLIPNRINSFTQINFPTRIFEYLAMHKPVLVPRTQGIGDYFGEDEILFFEGGNVEDLAAKIEWAWRHPVERQRVMEKGRAVYQKNSWDTEEQRLVGLVAGLTGQRQPK